MSTPEDANQSVANMLMTIRQLQERHLEIDSQTTLLVKACLEHNVTWKSIGRALGVSAQAAWRKYRPEEPEKITPGKGANHIDD